MIDREMTSRVEKRRREEDKKREERGKKRKATGEAYVMAV